MFRFLIGGMIMIIPCCVYLYFVLRRFYTGFRGTKPKGWINIIFAIAAICLMVPAVNLFSVWAMVILHILALSIVVDIVRLIIVKGFHKENALWHKIYLFSIIPLVGTVCIMIYGYWNMNHVTEVTYAVTTEKEVPEEGYRVAFISDTHSGTTLDRAGFEELATRIENEKPDLLVLGGDIVDEQSTMEEVKNVFETLGNVETTYGVFYVFGNHDKGTYSPNCDFTVDELRQTITDNGIQIMEDETFVLDEYLTISGRKDRNEMRVSSSELLEGDNSTQYHILVDHQPREFAQNAEAGFDLMLSGHTHAGQIWPVGLITTLFDPDTLNYGHEKEGNMDIIVSAGAAGWGYPIRTGKHSEYTIVEVKKAS